MSCFFRGTKEFKILVSNDMMTWEEAGIEGTLSNIPSNSNCGHMEYFPTVISEPKVARFVKFVAINYYSKGPGIQYFGLKDGIFFTLILMKVNCTISISKQLKHHKLIHYFTHCTKLHFL